MKSKAYVRFLNRAARFQVDLELLDVVGLAVAAGQLVDAQSKMIFGSVDPRKHPGLAGHKPTAHNRKLAVDHLKATLRAAYIKDLHEDFYAYLLQLVTAAARAGLQPGRLIGEHRVELEVNTVLACTTWEGVIEHVSGLLFRQLEKEQSTPKLLTAIDKKLGLKVDPKLLKAALPYLELRHLLVHRNGVADPKFCKDYPEFKATSGETIRLSHAIATAARETITKLAEAYDFRAVKAGLLGKEDMQPAPPNKPFCRRGAPRQNG
jgi:hypothetical protein